MKNVLNSLIIEYYVDLFMDYIIPKILKLCLLLPYKSSRGLTHKNIYFF